MPPPHNVMVANIRSSLLVVALTTLSTLIQMIAMSIDALTHTARELFSTDQIPSIGATVGRLVSLVNVQAIVCSPGWFCET